MMPMLPMKIFVILLMISSIKARCPSGDSVNIYGHSGVITANSGYLRKDKCEWKIFAPRQKRNHKITVHISKIRCTKNLVIEGEDFCQHKPRITRTYIPNSCKEDCKRSSCRKVGGYPLVITYGRYADDHGFVIRFAYEPCAAAASNSITGQPKTNKLQLRTTRSPKTTRLSKTAPLPTNTAAGNVNSIIVNTTVMESMTKQSTSNQASSVSPAPIVAIVAPVSAIFVISLLLIILGVKLKRTKQQNEMSKQTESIESMQSYIPTANVTGAALYETLNKKGSTESYTNETYRSLPMDGTGGEYSENKYDTVFQPTATMEPTATDFQPSATHIYEHVTSAAGDVTEAPPKIDHPYDEVASETDETDSFDDCSSEEESHA